MSLSLRTLSAAVCLALALGVSQDASAAGTGDSAMKAFKQRHGVVHKLVKRDAKSSKIQKEVDKLLDYSWLSKASLGGPNRFAKKCEPRCAEFESLLTKLIRQNYLKRITLGDKDSVVYVGEERRPKATKVTTRVEYVKNGIDQVVEIAYVMHKVKGKWVVRDIITDGVSLARNYKYEFNKILREGGVDSLILRLENKLAEVASTK